MHLDHLTPFLPLLLAIPALSANCNNRDPSKQPISTTDIQSTVSKLCAEACTPEDWPSAGRKVDGESSWGYFNIQAGTCNTYCNDACSNIIAQCFDAGCENGQWELDGQEYELTTNTTAY